jgi:hypothetical protein
MLTPQENKTKQKKSVTLVYVKSEQYNHGKKSQPRNGNWYFSAMNMQRASYHSAFQRLPTF